MKYCAQNNGDCSSCSLVNYGQDCHNNIVDRCDNCGQYSWACRCGDWISTLPVDPDEAARLDAKYSVDCSSFFGE